MHFKNYLSPVEQVHVTSFIKVYLPLAMGLENLWLGDGKLLSMQVDALFNGRQEYLQALHQGISFLWIAFT